MDDNGLLSPEDTQMHTLSSDICKQDENSVAIIKIEETFYEKEENEYDSKDGVLKFTSEYMSTGNNSVGVDEIKTERTFCEELEDEDGTKQSGKSRAALRDMPQCTSREIYEPNKIKIEAMICEEKENEFDHKNYSEMEDTKCLNVLQLFTSMDMTCNAVRAGDGVKTGGTFCEKLEMEDEVKHEMSLVDHKLNNVQQLCSKNALKYREEANEYLTETDEKKFLPYSHEKMEIVLNDPRNFDSFLHDPLKPVVNEVFEKQLPLVSETLSTSNEECRAEFGGSQSITDHVPENTETKNSPFKSTDKSGSSTIHGHFTRHSLKHETNLPAIGMYQCESCTFKAKTKTALRSHKMIHEKKFAILIYQCAVCSFQRRTKEAVELHVLIHKDLPTDKTNSILTMYQCESCSYQAKSKFSIKAHSLRVHKNPSKVTTYQCSHCPFQTKCKSSFTKHVSGYGSFNKSRPNTGIYRCYHCRFQTKSIVSISGHLQAGLPHHTLIHEKRGLFQCDSCSFQTIYESSFANHSLTHSLPL